MVRVYERIADIKVKRLNWRGLWATKQIEGTVDDDVAAKLAVGEGKQADLEQERLELQALNSERFRHRFLERNRPWILQHLVELLTPRSLDQVKQQACIGLFLYGCTDWFCISFIAGTGWPSHSGIREGHLRRTHVNGRRAPQTG